MHLRVILKSIFSISSILKDINFQVLESLETLPKITTSRRYNHIAIIQFTFFPLLLYNCVWQQRLQIRFIRM